MYSTRIAIGRYVAAYLLVAARTPDRLRHPLCVGKRGPLPAFSLLECHSCVGVLLPFGYHGFLGLL